MRYPAFVRAAAGALATAAILAAGSVHAQSPQSNEGVQQPPTMTDTAPTPAHDRSSVGAVILMDEPVLAQREALLQAQARTSVDTRAMGAGPARLLRGAQQKKEMEQELRKQFEAQQKLQR